MAATKGPHEESERSSTDGGREQAKYASIAASRIQVGEKLARTTKVDSRDYDEKVMAESGLSDISSQQKNKVKAAKGKCQDAGERV